MFSANSSQVSDDKLFVEDVFSTWLHAGNDSTQTITNGIDLAGKGGLVWVKSRNAAFYHALNDTARGAGKVLQSQATSAQINQSSGLSAFTSSGFSIGSDNGYNSTGYNYASWSFRKAPKFFDVVTYTGNGSFSRNISHSLGVAPGFIIVKRTDTTSNWWTYHRGIPGNINGFLNLTDAFSNSGYVEAGTTPATSFLVYNYGGNDLNVNGATYVAYLFAHDTTSDGIIQCGSVTADGSGNATASLGWEPQWLIYKYSDTTGNWRILDNMRGWVDGSNDALLSANTSDAESSAAQGNPTATGFSLSGLAANKTFIYIAIRRGPMRTPTSGTSVFSPIARTGTATTFTDTTNFAVDSIWFDARSQARGALFIDRLRGFNKFITPNNTNAENTNAGYVTAMGNTGFTSGTDLYFNDSGQTYVDWCFRRAPSFFDEVCYTGTGVARTVNHNLGVAPELMIVKQRNGTNSWAVYAASQGASKYGLLNSSLEFTATDASYWNSTDPTPSVFSVGTQGRVNGSGSTYVAYLFASCPGVSKVGTYTGNDSSQTIDCGFAAGARFVMIKGISGGGVGDWYVWDTARGIVASNDPHLSLNNTAAEITTDDTIDTTNSGFIVNQNTATYANYTGTTYIYLAVA